MADIKLTKTELRIQQQRFGELSKYLPILQLKKAMLQSEVLQANQELVHAQENYFEHRTKLEKCSGLLEVFPFDYRKAIQVKELRKRIENIAGVEVPIFDGIDFLPCDYDLFDTPPWTESLIEFLQLYVKSIHQIKVAEEKKKALEKELEDVSIRVNLFDKVLIPRTEKNIKKIKVFLGDQLLAAVSQSKAAKTKIEKKASYAR